MNFMLSIDQIASTINQPQKIMNIAYPVIQDLILILLPYKVNNSH